MKYDVRFASERLKDIFYSSLESIPSQKTQERILEKTRELANDPRPQNAPKIKPPITVYSLVAQFRIRIGDYRVLYDVDDKKKIVWILALRRRGEGTYKR